jgi:hypothetical protein
MLIGFEGAHVFHVSIFGEFSTCDIVSFALPLCAKRATEVQRSLPDVGCLKEIVKGRT